ncbi:MAG: glycosyltransferase [Bacteroidota bacterium]|nr:glycosyltransferase [Bacteroidota bacterium]
MAPYPGNEAPSQRYRLEHYFSYLEEQGISYAYKPFLSLSTWRIFFRPGNYFRKVVGLLGGFARRALLMLTIPGYDYVYIHREASPAGPPIFVWVIAKLFRKRIIYDFDDAIWIPSSSQYNKIARSIKWFSKVATICKWSYKVSAGNDYLAAFASKYNKNVIIVPTVVDTELTHNKMQDHETDHPVIGWTGSFSTLKYLDIILPVLQRLQEKFEFTFVVIADKDPALPLKRYRFIPWRKETGDTDLLSMHIGVMPLYNDELSKGKCGFKAIQYMSMGIPAVVSPVGVNNLIVDDGINGFICDDLDEWELRLTQLLTNKDLRKRLGVAARKKIESNYSVSATRDKFLSLFS